MAKAATKENVGRVGDAAWQAARNIIKTDIARAKGAQQKAAGEAGQAWTRIEGMGINKKGAQMFGALLNMDPGTAADVCRTFNKLAKLEGFFDKDLVDQINDGDIDQAELAEMTAPKSAAAAPEEPDSKQDIAAGDIEPPKRGRGRPAKPKAPDGTFVDALKAAAEPKPTNVTPIKKFGAKDGDLADAGDAPRKTLGIAVPDAMEA